MTCTRNHPSASFGVDSRLISRLSNRTRAASPKGGRLPRLASCLRWLALGLAAIPIWAADLPSLPAIETGPLTERTRTLASDAFEGRGVGTSGEEKTVAYLAEEFRKLGLKGGSKDAIFFQEVPLTGSSSLATIHYETGGKSMPLAFPGQCVVGSPRYKSAVEVENSEIVFVGYGVTAPEFNWDDYKGANLRGKTLLMLVNDPPIPSSQDPSKLDDSMFRGSAMTYYGRWTYKFEAANAQGAAAALIVHETAAAGYPWMVVVGSWARENFELKTPDGNAGRMGVEGWIHHDQARQLLAAAGQDYESLKVRARQRDFKPVPLGVRFNAKLQNTLREIRSRNVIARLDGSDPDLRRECVVFSAHWDHLGRNDKLEGDKIFNGARDNATGVAALLEIARAFKSLPLAPKRSILFLAPTAEESGLLGARHYALHPAVPLEHTLANINMDSMNQWGRTRDLNVIGLGFSTLDELLAAAAQRHGRIITPDSEPEKGRYYRSDHFEFAKLGVPGLYTQAGIDFIGRPKEFAMTKSDEYTLNDYHKVTDEVKPDWDLSGTAADAQLMFEVGLTVAQGPAFPEWKPGAEFKARREAMLKKR